MDEPSSSRPSQPVSGDDPNMEVTASGEMIMIKYSANTSNKFGILKKQERYFLHSIRHVSI